MEDLELYLSVAATILGLLVSTLTFLTKFIKSAKEKRIAEELLQLTQDLMPFIEEAEKFIHFTGVEKKAYVMTKATQLVINNKMKVSQGKISDTIDGLVRLTKEVNVRISDTKEKTFVLPEINSHTTGTYIPTKELQKIHD